MPVTFGNGKYMFDFGSCWATFGLAKLMGGHEEPNHQGLDNRLISGPAVIHMTNRVRRRTRLDGVLNFYERAA